MATNTTNKSNRRFLKMPIFRRANQQKQATTTQPKNATSIEAPNTTLTDNSSAQAKAGTKKKKTLLQIATDYEKEKQAKLKAEKKMKDKNAEQPPPSNEEEVTNGYDLLQDWRPTTGHICQRCGQDHLMTEDCAIC